MNDYIVTAKVGNNKDLFPDILSLYVPPGSYILDMTWGNGNFWKEVDYDRAGIGVPRSDYIVVANDIDMTKGDYHDDFRGVQWASDTFDAVVLDPPYLYVGGFKTLRSKLDVLYSNKERAESGIYGVEAVDRMYYDGMKEAHRVLKPKGILIVKCMDQVMSGKQVWGHVTYLGYGEELGFRNEDLFVLVMNHQPLMRHAPDHQKHARRNHSYFLVMRKNGS